MGVDLNPCVPFFRRGLEDTVPFSEIVKRIPPSPPLLNQFPKFFEVLIGRSPPSSPLKEAGPCLIKLKTKNISPFRSEDALESVDHQLFKIIPWKSKVCKMGAVIHVGGKTDDERNLSKCFSEEIRIGIGKERIGVVKK